MKKCNVRISASGVNDSLMHIEARKDSHPDQTLFITYAKISDNRYHYGWQLMHQGEIKSADGSANPITHEALGEAIQQLIENTFIEDSFKHIDQNDYLLMD